MENSGEINLSLPQKETRLDQYKWKNLFGENVCDFQPQPKSLINNEGRSIVNTDVFVKRAFLEPVRTKEETDMIIPLNKIIAMSTSPDIDDVNSDHNHVHVSTFRNLIKEGKFDFNDSSGIHGLELPGGYIILSDGRHRLTAMFLEHIPQAKINVSKIIPNEFDITDNYNSRKRIEQKINDGSFKGATKEDKYGNVSLHLDSPQITNPLQLFGDFVPTSLIDVMAQTL